MFKNPLLYINVLRIPLMLYVNAFTLYIFSAEVFMALTCVDNHLVIVHAPIIIHVYDTVEINIMYHKQVFTLSVNIVFSSFRLC